MKFELFKDAKGEWRWRFKAANGKCLSVSSEGYKNRGDCAKALATMRRCKVCEVVK